MACHRQVLSSVKKGRVSKFYLVKTRQNEIKQHWKVSCLYTVLLVIIVFICP